VPRAGLTTAAVVAAGAELADEAGYHNLTLGLVARRLNVRAPSLYKHVTGLADLQHRIAALAMTELRDAFRAAAAGRAGRDALAALARALRGYVTAHPGRYLATVGAGFTGPDDPLLRASTEVIDLITVVLGGYGIAEAGIVHAIRSVRCTLHGFATLQAVDGFQWGGDIEESFDRLVDFIDAGLRAAAADAG